MRTAEQIIADLEGQRDQWAKEHGVKDATTERRIVRDGLFVDRKENPL